MWANELTLIQETYTEDEIGNQVATEDKTTIFCDIKSVGRAEFYNAVATGLKPEIIFIIHNYEYSGENQVEYDGKKYNVIRTYENSTEELELTCEKVLNNG